MASSSLSRGVRRLKEKLRRMGPAVQDDLEAAVLRGAQEIANTARTLVPRDTGGLAGSIGAVKGDAPATTATQSLRGSTGSNDADSVRATAFVGDDNAYYAGWVEFGTAGHAAGGMFEGSKHPGTAAQPFFFPAYRVNRKRALGRIKRAIKAAIKKAAAAP